MSKLAWFVTAAIFSGWSIALAVMSTPQSILLLFSLVSVHVSQTRLLATRRLKRTIEGGRRTGFPLRVGNN
jgi:hypothetical protein